jgi:hypothetical protein
LAYNCYMFIFKGSSVQKRTVVYSLVYQHDLVKVFES